MRRRRPLNVWPAFADLMTVLAIVGLFTAISLSSFSRKVVAYERQVQGLESDLQEARAQAARNQAMFDAIQRAQSIVDDISASADLEFAEDQTLQFGDSLVTFDINSLEPIWSNDGRRSLRDFCQSLASRINTPTGGIGNIGNLLTVQVEGHTDDTTCGRRDPECNWRFSSGRAAAFVAVMRSPDYCPGGQDWEVRSIGFADTRPLSIDGRQVPTRRIAIRLVPDYTKLIASQPR